MGYPRRRSTLRNYISKTNPELYVISEPEKEIYSLYAFLLSQELSNYEAATDCEVFTTLVSLAKLWNSEERFITSCKKIIELGIEKGKLHPCTSDEEEHETEEVGEYEKNSLEKKETEKQYDSFMEDLTILEQAGYFTDNIPPEQMMFLQALYTETSGTLSKIFYLTFLSDSYDALFNNEFELTDPMVKKLKDVSQLKFLQSQTGLSDEETLLLLISYRMAVYPTLKKFIPASCETTRKYYSILSLLPKATVEQLTLSNQKLREFGLFNSGKVIDDDLLECIENQDFNLFFSSFIKPYNPSSTYSLESFNVKKEETNLVMEMLSSNAPVSILLYGKPGSGKTEYAKALAKTTGKEIVIFKNETENEVRKPFLAKLNCLLSLNRPDTILIIDEADTILQTKSENFFGFRGASTTKGLVNKMLENSKNQVLWIVNYPKLMDESTRRRFTFSCRFEAMPSDVIKKITRTKLQTTGLSDQTQEKILSLITKYHITGSSVDNVVKVLNCISTNDEQSVLEKVDLLLKENSRLLDDSANRRKCVTSAYDSSVLNTSISSEKIVNMVRNAISFSEKNQAYSDTKQGIRMLFYGLSGTGKTEFARYISQKLGKDVLLKRASDILDKYVGGTEQKIADAFSEAAANDQILLLDEADSFFQDRNSAEHSWEITKVNELLTQMEEFPGILICTTNLKNIMDSAMSRRFHITVEFKALEKAGVEKLLENYFSAYAFTDSQINQLVSYESVTPGDFSRLSETIRFMDAEEISSNLIIEELCKIQEEKDPSAKRRVGFI